MDQKTIVIDSERCIRCGHCVRICPSEIFRHEGSKEEKLVPQVLHPEHCIGCGHCMGVCPTGAIGHSLFPAEKVHPIDRQGLPTPEQVMLLVRARRSNRAFSAAPVPAQKLSAIVEAAHRAPTASNLQQVSFTVVTDPQVLRSVSQFVIDHFGSMLKWVDKPVVRPVVKAFMPQVMRYLPIFKKMKRNFETGAYDGILRGATALLLIHTPARGGTAYGAEDCNLAYQNGSLMAESLGVGQFYTGFLLNAIKGAKGELEKRLGIGGQRIWAGMALGMPEFPFVNYIDRKALRVTYLEATGGR